MLDKNSLLSLHIICHYLEKLIGIYYNIYYKSVNFQLELKKSIFTNLDPLGLMNLRDS